MSLIYLTFQSPSFIVFPQISNFNNFFLSTKLHNAPIPTSLAYTTRACQTPKNKCHQTSILKDPSSNKVSNIKSKIKTPTTTHSFHYPFSTTQRLPKSTYSYHTHTINKIINCQTLVKHMISRCF